MRDVRVFVSSPGDAAHERRRVERVVERLNGAFAGAVRLTAIRWETGFYAAHDTFQAQIPEAADCDIVIAIFKARLGTALPATFPRMADGEPYPSGTAYEVLSAIAARKERNLPDVFVFRHPHAPTVRLDDPAGEALVKEQWARLKAFFERWFVTPEGQFKAAFQTYDDTDAFEDQVEALLKGWVEEHVLGAHAITWSVEVKGSPFRGLEAFGAKHAQVFFGRARDVEKAVEALKDAAEAPDRLPFLLLIGPSGAGKSSLARAGLVPRLTTPGVVPDVAVWRTAVARPSEVAGGPFLSLATRLFDRADDLPEAEKGRPGALPELGEGDHATPHELASLLEHADAPALKPILKALDRVAAAEQAAAASDRPLEARLLLVIDQLDELFGAEVSADRRASFATLLTGLVETRRVCIIGTLRADLYELYSREPTLLALKTRGATYDVAPPGAAALEDIVRKPAETAGLVYEERVCADGTRQRLDERLIAEAERPDMLPLMQFTLNRLFEARETQGTALVLTHAAYDRLGGLDGAIAEEAERALKELGDAERARLPRLLRQLVAGAEETGAKAARRLAIRSVPYHEAAHDRPAKALVDALVKARILTSEAGGAVRLAHQRVIEAWPRARNSVAIHASYFRIAREVDEAKARWQGRRRPADLLLPRGVALSEAEAILAEFHDEIAPDTRGFIEASARRARRAQRLAFAAATVFALVALGAVAMGYEAKHTFDMAKENTSTIFSKISEGFSETEGVKGDALRHVLVAIHQGLDRLVQDAPHDPDLIRQKGAIQTLIGDLLEAKGDHSGALAAFEEATNTYRPLSALRRPFEWSFLGMSANLEKKGDLHRRMRDFPRALAAYEEARKMTREFFARGSRDISRQLGLAALEDKIGDMRREAGNYAGAIQAYEEALKDHRPFPLRDPAEINWLRVVALTFNKITSAQFDSGDVISAERTSLKWVSILEQPDLNVELVEALTSRGWYLLFLRRFAESEAVARQALDLSPADPVAQANLIPALLLQGKWEEAEKLYLDNLGELKALVRGRPWREAISNNFQQLRAAGITHPDMDRIEALLRAPRLTKPSERGP